MQFLWIIFLFCFGCQKYGLMLRQQRVDATYLASTHVGSPDPRQKCPPNGQMLIAEWWIPSSILNQEPKLVVYILFRNYTEKVVEYSLTKRVGYEVFPLYGADFTETGGLLTYKAEIVTCNGEVYREWKHQMWVNLIQIEPRSR